MKEIYNNLVDLLTSSVFVPMWVLIAIGLFFLALIIYHIILVSKLDRELFNRLAHISDLGGEIQTLEEDIESKKNLIKKKENLLKETQTKFAEYRTNIEEEKFKAQEQFKVKEESRPTAKVGKASPSTRPSRKKDEIVGEKDQKPTTRRSTK